MEDKKYCDICNEELTTEKEIKASLCANCIHEFDLTDEDLMCDDDFDFNLEECTQPSNVDGGILSVFGSNGNNTFDKDNWYKQLFELNDLNDNSYKEYKIISSVLENTGGGSMVEYGQFSNGLYFALNDEFLVLYDADYHKAWLQDEDGDLSDWENEHRVEYYTSQDREYQIVSNQTKYFKKDDEQSEEN